MYEPSRLVEIIKKYNLFVGETPEGAEDIEWLVREVERLRRDMRSWEEADERAEEAISARDDWKLRYHAIDWQARNGGCLNGPHGKLEERCGKCALCEKHSSDLDKYQDNASRTADTSQHRDVRLAISALGIAGEAGEVADLVKKWVGHGHERKLDLLKKELGDVLWYVADIASIHGMKLSDIALLNIEKLRERYPDGFSHDRSRNRSLEEEP